MVSVRRKKPFNKQKAVISALIVAVLSATVFFCIRGLRAEVTARFGEVEEKKVQSAQVTSGSIHTSVTGAGTLQNEETEEFTIPKEVEVTELYVEAGDRVNKGDMLASVDSRSVLEAMAGLQEEMDEVDEALEALTEEGAQESITAGVSGRVKKIYAAQGQAVSETMYEKQALALISIDGYMAVDVEVGSLQKGDSVTVTGRGGIEYEGTVDTIWSDTATILIPDDGPEYGDTVTVSYGEGQTASGSLYIHEEVSVTGYSGMVSSVDVSENETVSQGDTLFTLEDTSQSVNYAAQLEQRKELEDEMQALVTIYKEGAFYASDAGLVASVTESGGETQAVSAKMAETTGFSMEEASGGASAAEGNEETEDTVIAICPTKQMSISVSIDESDILAVSVGQEAAVSIDSFGEETFSGTVTEVDQTGSSSNGAASYSATVVIDRTDAMLEGMSASAVITVEGKDNALLLLEDAVNKTSSSSYVYTSYDENTGEFGDRVEITTGLSDGSSIEVTDGLSEGDTVYYQKEESGASETPFGETPFGNNGFFKGQDGATPPGMPSGNGMGSGGAFRGGAGRER